MGRLILCRLLLKQHAAISLVWTLSRNFGRHAAILVKLSILEVLERFLAFVHVWLLDVLLNILVVVFLRALVGSTSAQT